MLSIDDPLRADEDARLRSFVRRCYPSVPLTAVAIRRALAPERVTLSIQTPYPALVIGPRGTKLDTVRRALHAKTGLHVHLTVRAPSSDKEAVFT